MKAYWKKAYSCWYANSNNLDSGSSESAVARLLADRPRLVDMPISNAAKPVDLSSKNAHETGEVTSYPTFLPITSLSNIQPNTAEKITNCEEDSLETIQKGMCKEMEMLKNSKPIEGLNAAWKCRFCPYSAPNSSILYSHYQFHQQLLTSQSSKPHQEWLAAYRRAKEENERRNQVGDPVLTNNAVWGTSGPSSYGPIPYPGPGCPPGTVPGAPYSLKSLLTKHDAPQNSASGFLRSIVKAVMANTTPNGMAPTSSTVYASLLSKTAETTSTYSVNPSQTILKIEASSPKPRDTLSSEYMLLQKRKRKMQAAPEEAPATKYTAIDNTTLGNTVTAGYMGMVCERSCSPDLDVVGCDSDVPDIGYASGVQNNYNIEELPLAHYPVDIPRMTSEVVSCNNATIASEIGSSVHDLGVSKSYYTPPGGSPSLYGAYYTRHYSTSVGESVIQSQMTPEISDDDVCPNFRQRASSLTRRRSVESRSSDLSSKRGHSPYDINTLTSDYHPAVHSDSSQFTIRNYDQRKENVSSTPVSEIGVQCELFPEFEGHKNSRVLACNNCGISFDDDVMFSIHMGMHNHTDPFVCNLCGKSCGNKYAFYTHINRGHHA